MKIRKIKTTSTWYYKGDKFKLMMTVVKLNRGKLTIIKAHGLYNCLLYDSFQLIFLCQSLFCQIHHSS